MTWKRNNSLPPFPFLPLCRKELEFKFFLHGGNGGNGEGEKEKQQWYYSYLPFLRYLCVENELRLRFFTQR